MNGIPILAYHSLHAPGDDYATNDHVALEIDLCVIKQCGFKIAPLLDIAHYVAGTGANYLDSGKWVGLSFDDGPDWDYYDFDADGRKLKSFRRILLEATDPSANFYPRATSFVIASPDARRRLDALCIAGRDNWGDTWWLKAANEGLLAIGNHSWDHAHPAFSPDCARAFNRDSFHGVNNLETADRQIANAEDFIRSKIGNRSTGLFAYPYGDAPSFVVEEYLPLNGPRLGIMAAFQGDGRYASRGDNRWKIPRFEFREHWKLADHLVRILDGAATH